MSANIQRPPSVRGLTIEHDMALGGPHMWLIFHLRLLPTEALKNRATLGLIDSDTTFEQYTQTTTIQRSQPYLARSLDTRGCQLVHGEMSQYAQSSQDDGHQLGRRRPRSLDFIRAWTVGAFQKG
ncbi:hypothetical protein FOYG_16570 [Fusarium oxysporum NRRL 32931]|uniref:Uncharacterized protein n=1 Tax=Fusarium oxysporum NRRL 32931 TaxID=660029 RepID=W9HI45_FUSOX|nr:hypothetical protein FOYG_16570 [Fusarium oxysporum NRRL 32931]